jgi:hypothetical protein
MAAIRGSPHYWTIGGNYAGDRSSYSGLALLASIWCKGSGPAQSGDDVILSGGGQELRISAPKPPEGGEGRGGWV